MCKTEKLIHVFQIGFREDYRTSDHMFSLKTLLKKYTLEKPSGKLHSCFYRVKKAYVFSKSENLNLGGKILELINDKYENAKCAVKIQNKVQFFSRVIEE